MKNQVFIQPDATIEKVHEEDVFHALIQAQLTQSLTEIDTLLQDTNSLSKAASFTVSQPNKKLVTKRPLLKIWTWKNAFTSLKKLFQFKRFLAKESSSTN